MRKQLDLFRAEVIAFPLARRSCDVQHMAKFLWDANGRHAERGWRRHCLSMARELRRSGVSEAEIRREMLDFQAAVGAELCALTHNLEEAQA